MRTFAVDQQRINTGGMMRCCTTSIDGLLRGIAAENKEVTEGTTLQCLYTPDPSHRWILDEHGIWRWDHVNHDD